MKIFVFFAASIAIFVAIEQVQAKTGCPSGETYCQKQCRLACAASQNGDPIPPPKIPGRFCHCPFCRAKPNCDDICKKACDASKEGTLAPSPSVCSCPACITS